MTPLRQTMFCFQATGATGPAPPLVPHLPQCPTVPYALLLQDRICLRCHLALPRRHRSLICQDVIFGGVGWGCWHKWELLWAQNPDGLKMVSTMPSAERMNKDNAPDGYEKPNVRQCREFSLMSLSSPQDLRDKAVRVKIQWYIFHYHLQRLLSSLHPQSKGTNVTLVGKFKWFVIGLNDKSHLRWYCHMTNRDWECENAFVPKITRSAFNTSLMKLSVFCLVWT